MQDCQARHQGALAQPDGSVQWRVWAPKARRVDLVLLDRDQRRTFALTATERNHFELTLSNIPEDQRYWYRLDGGPDRPDPASLWQPDGVDGPSAVVRTDRFPWSDRDWHGLARQDLVFYELHVGTFTPEGTFEAIIPRLPALRELGVTALELMPVAQFPGTRNWGYDGVLPFAVQNSYGGPHGLQRFVDACHAAGLALFLDVVYNHFGPEGCYFAEFGPYFTGRYRTFWGSAINYDDAGSDPVRRFMCDNARMWIEEFHVDGLRLDAVHAIYDLGARHLLQAIKETAEAAAARAGRQVHIVAESDLNDPRLLLPPERGGYGLDAQWSDDFHHAVHGFLTEERQGYYADFGEARDLAGVLREPFLYAGRYSPARDRTHGAPPGDLPGDRFVVCIQNHDQVGNRARGDRLSTLLDPPAQRLAASLLLLSPYLPLLFMGEEYGERHPFLFFCSFCDTNLVQSVREGRKREFEAFSWQGEVPDPQSEDTFAASRLRWSWPEGTPAAGLRRLYADLLAARRQWPALRDFRTRSARLLPDEKTPAVLELVRAGELLVLFNLTDRRQPLFTQPQTGRQVLFASEVERYHGGRKQVASISELLPHECVVFGPAGWTSFLR